MMKICIIIISIILETVHFNRCEKHKAEGIESSADGSNERDEYSTVNESTLGPPFGIVINGHSLVSVIECYRP